MRLRQEVEIYLQEKNYPALVKQALQNPGVFKYLYRLFYHPYGLDRWRAIEGLGLITSAMAQDNPEGVREILRRLLWSMNDESGTTGWSSPEAVGEIVFHQPELFSEYISIVVYASEEEIFHRGVAWALGRIAQKRPDLMLEFQPLLREYLADPRPDVRGHAAWALGQMGTLAKASLPELRPLLGDDAQIEVYEGQEVVLREVGQLARRAIARIEN